MVVFNYSTRELTTKVVYYGPGLCGKTTNLQFIYDHMPQGVRGKMLSLATKSDRTLFFDFLPIDLGQIQGMKTKVQLYTVPGQVFYNETRRLVLKGADGVVFVADSQENMLEANLDSFRNLEENLQAHGLVLADLPHVIQFNKRDLPTASPVEALNEKINKYNVPFYEAIATTGVGVQETLRHISKLVLLKLNERYGTIRSTAAGRPAPASPPRPAPAPVPMAAELPTIAMAAPADFSFAEPPAAPAGLALGQAAALRLESPPALSVAGPAAMVEDQVSFSLELPALDPAAPAEPAPAAAAPADQEFDFTFGEEPPTKAPVIQAAPLSPEPEPTLVEAAAEAFPAAEPMDLEPAAAPEVEDDDILGVVPAWTEAPEAIQEPPPAVLQAPPPGPLARATAELVSPADALFHEEGLTPTRLLPGQPQDILIPLEVHTPQGNHYFRLTLRLEIKP